MTKLNLPYNLEDKIFEIQRGSDGMASKITSYFPLTGSEKRDILFMLNMDSFDIFHSIFSDIITDEEWNKTKEQIKEKFKDELFDIDKI